MYMKLLYAAFAVLLFALLLPATALGAGNGTDTNLTPVSISQNATISVPTASMVGLTRIGVFENATVYVSGGANATIKDDRLVVDMGEASWMDYRDVYLLYRLPPGFQNFSFDYDLAAGEKSNVLLIDFYNGTPQTGVKKGGIADRSTIGMGTWTSRGYDVGGISGLKPFAQGAHHVDIFPSGDMLYMRLDGKNVTAFNYYSQKKYLLLHLMVGDEASYLRGTLSGLKYEGPALDIPVNTTTGNHRRHFRPSRCDAQRQQQRVRGHSRAGRGRGRRRCRKEHTETARGAEHMGRLSGGVSILRRMGDRVLQVH